MKDKIQKVLKLDKRSALIGKNIFFSFILKAWSALAIFLLVPYTLKCLGEYQNGVWLTISSLLLWIDQLDIGLGNGLRNKLATYVAENNLKKARQAVSSTFVMLIFLVIPITITLCAIISNIDIYALLNVNNSISELNKTIIVAIVLVCSTFILKFIGNFYLGLQLPAINNLLVVMGQTFALIATMLLYYLNIHSFRSIVIANTSMPLVVYIIAYIYSFYYKYKNLQPSLSFIDKGMVKELLGYGLQFFFLQISGGVLFMTSNVLISKLFSPAMVTPYQITYRYFSIILMVFTVICTPYWTATTDAYKRHDIEWIKKSNIVLNKVIAGIGIAILFMVLFSSAFYNLWIGKDTNIPIDMTISMAIFTFVTIISLRYSYIINGFGFLRLQLYTTCLASIVFIPLAICVANLTNTIMYLILTMCIVNIPGMCINVIQYKKIINNKATGIWKQ